MVIKERSGDYLHDELHDEGHRLEPVFLSWSRGWLKSKRWTRVQEGPETEAEPRGIPVSVSNSYWGSVQSHEPSPPSRGEAG